MKNQKMTDHRKISHSQNFLKSSSYVKTLLDLTNIGKKDLVVEIGAGKGIITAELSKKAGRVVAIELDASLAQSLKRKFCDDSSVEVIKADFLRWKLPSGNYKVFANIPFNMTADIVNKLIFADNPPTSAFLFMQDKAAARFIGEPVGQNSQVSIFLQPFYDMKIEIEIPSNKFVPRPNIKIVLASFKKRRKPFVDWPERKLYWDFVVYGYNQWQPTILDAFSRVFSSKQLKMVAKGLGLSGLKPSQLTVEQWGGLFEAFLKYVPKEKQMTVNGAVKRLRKKQIGMIKQHRRSPFLTPQPRLDH
jgi:23S rRNA (adenine-N6)-dimethyltransferase